MNSEIKIKQLLKSKTILSGALGISVINGAMAYKEPIVKLIDGFIGDGVGEAFYHIFQGVVSLLTLFGVIKGRVEAETNQPLSER